MLIEQEAPLLFHTVFAGAIVLTIGYLLYWRRRSAFKKPAGLVLCFVLLQIPAYITIFYAFLCPGSGERTLSFALGGLCWLISILVLMQGIKELLGCDSK